MGDVAALTWPLTRPGGPLPVLSNRARRCLFGPVDHEKAKVHLEEQMGKIFEEKKLQWNFDFHAGQPLPAGQYKWEAVDPNDADSNGGSSPNAEEENSENKEVQSRITDFMRKRKSSNEKESVRSNRKSRRRSST